MGLVMWFCKGYFFTNKIPFRMCLHQFKYTGKRQIAGKTGGKPGTTKAMTLPARMQPPDFSGDSPVLPVHSGSSSVGRDGIQQIGMFTIANEKNCFGSKSFLNK
jgi:hypothetical protein